MHSKTLITVSLLLLVVGLALAVTTNSPTVSNVTRIHPQQYASVDDSMFYTCDFEQGWEEWSSSDLTAVNPTWHKDDFNAFAGLSWWSGDTLIMGYDNHWLQYLISPSFSLVGATNPTLSFKLKYEVETPAGATAPYDGWDGCNVWISTDGGSTWTVVTPTTPAYNCQSLYSFGEEFGMGAGIAGWGGSSGGWVPAEMSLSRWIGASNVKLRFAFCSDPAECTLTNPSLLGMFVDNILVMSGTTTLISNDCDATPVPSEFAVSAGEASGDWWIIDTATHHSGLQCATCAHDNHWGLSNVLTSPWISIPEGYTSYFTFWVHCDMLDWDGDQNNYLEDYYMVEVSHDGIVFEYNTLGFYDYGDQGRPGAATVGWEEYVPGLPFNGNMQMDLTSAAGEDLKFRFRIVTDNNNDGGIGTGFHMDDFTIWGTSALNNDCGAANLHIPFPTSISNMPLAGTVELHNYGRVDQTSVAGFVRVDQMSPIPLVPWSSIPSMSYVDKTFSLNLTNTGEHWIASYTQMVGDENMNNDTTSAYYVDITPAHYYELGYDNREVSWNGGEFSYFTFDPGEGAMCKFSMESFEFPEAVDITGAKMIFYSAGNFNLHIYDAGSGSTPGTELASIPVTIGANEIFPNWKEVDLSSVTALQAREGDFWLWVEVLNANTAQILGDDISFGNGQYFTKAGTSVLPSQQFEFYIRAIAEGVLGVSGQTELSPNSYGLAQNFPNPFNPVTSIQFSLAKAGQTTLRVYNVQGGMVAELVNGNMEAGINSVAFDASKMSSGVYFYKLESGDFSSVKKMVLMK